MMNNQWIKKCRAIGGLGLLLYAIASCANATSWQDEPEVREQLHQLGLELALADVHPKLTYWWQQAVAPASASDYADDQLLLGLQSFWRYWSSLSFIERQHLSTGHADLTASEIDLTNLRLDTELGRREQVVQNLTPGYGDYQHLQNQLTRLLALHNTPWPTLRTATIRPHDRLPIVANIRERLQLLGDMPQAPAVELPAVPDMSVTLNDIDLPSGVSLEEPTLDFSADSGLAATTLNSAYVHDNKPFNDPTSYDDAMVAGIKRFQTRHGLTADGVIGPQTYAWLDTSPLTRAQLLMRSQIRTLISDELPGSYLLVNIPEYQLRLYQNQVLVLESNVIVGQLKRKTPIMHSQITNVVFNPPWNVPRSIMNKDIIPKLYRDPGYIERLGFDVLDGNEVVPRIEWQTRLEAGGGFPYRLRQRPGHGNALGAYKFHLPTNNAIYLHDTPTRGLFARDSRALSSGCVRVEGAEQLADWLLHNQLSPQRLAALKSNPETRWIKVAEPLPLFMVYWPGWVSADGKLHFRNDIYGFDKKLNNPF